MPKESSIVASVLKWMNGQPATLARKRHGGPFGLAGEPDISACVRGRSVQIELKQPGEKPTEMQMRRLDEWRRAGAVAFWATSLAEVRSALEREGLA
jgi:hypothetical protein